MKRLLLFLCLVCACPISPSAQSPNSVASPASKILVVIDKSTQEMKVFVDNVERYRWKVSTGSPGFETPSGTYRARSLHRIWYSKQWDDAPMPHAIFFTKKGHAIHGTGETKKLGLLASHGCVRLAPENARTLFALIKEKGLKDTQIVLNGETPSSEVQVASPAPPLPEKKPPQADTQIVRNEETPSREVQASPAPPLPEKEPPRENTQIVLHEETPNSEAQVASPAPPMLEKKPPQENAQIVLNEETPSSEVQVASPAKPKPEKKPPQANAQIVLNEETPSSEVQVASPAPPMPEKKPPQENAQIVLNEETSSSEMQVASPAKPKPEKKPKALAPDVADVNAAKSREQRPVTKSVNQKLGTAATNLVNDKLLDASVKKPQAQREKPATRRTASRSRSKPSLVGTPARSLSAEASPKIANAAYAASVYGALARKKPRSVGASGSVTVAFAIGPSGSLRNALVARSSGKAPLDRAALTIIRQAAPFSPPPGSRQSYTITISFR
jgi:TonB family protein